MKKKAQDLFRLAKQALLNAGAHEAMAESTAQHLVRAEEQGLPTHGMSRVPFYCSMLRNGRADGRAKPSMAAEKAAVCLIDNADGLPYESAAWAIEEVIQRARRNGIGFAGIRNSAHVGVLGIHLLKVAQAGMVGVAFTNSPAAIPAWGGKKALFGTDPVAFAFPRQGAEPIVVDLALTTVTRGKIMVAMQKGEKIPEGWALDRHGKPTTDPKAAIEQGSLFPIGGIKGAMLALAFELVCAALTGAAIGLEADSFFSESGNKHADRPGVPRHRSGRARGHGPCTSSASRPWCAPCSPTKACACPAPSASPPRRSCAPKASRSPTSCWRGSRSSPWGQSHVSRRPRIADDLTETSLTPVCRTPVLLPTPVIPPSSHSRR